MSEGIDDIDYAALARHYKLTLEIIRDMHGDSHVMRTYAAWALDNEHMQPVSGYGEHGP